MRASKFFASVLLFAALIVWPFAAMTDAEGAKSQSEAKKKGGEKSPEHAYGGFPDPATLGGSFSLIDHHGRPISDQDFRGHYMLLYFGYTRCQESCPLALRTIDRVLDLLGKDSKKIQPLFVSFDKRDGSQELATYLSEIDPRIVGLSGSVKQIFDIVRSFKVRREHAHITQSPEPGDHRINHSTWIFLVAPDGQTLDFYYHTTDAEELAEGVRRHLGKELASSM
jgi:protein SCO1/2